MLLLRVGILTPCREFAPGDYQLSDTLRGDLTPDTVLHNAVTKKHSEPESVWGSAVLNIQGGK